MTEKQLEQFHKVRSQYLKDLEKLRRYYLRKFLKILGPAE